MSHRDYKPVLARIAEVLALVLVVFGLLVWRSYESDRAYDTMQLSAYAPVQNALYLYYLNHAQYPAAPHGVVEWPSRDATCLSDDGFTRTDTPSCQKRSYVIYDEHTVPRVLLRFRYRSKETDGIAICTTLSGCPLYDLPVYLRSTLYTGTRGAHLLTPQGLVQATSM